MSQDSVQDSVLENALKRLEAAVSLAEAATARWREVELRRGSLEMELTVMQDDRSRLAADLDGALFRLNRLEAAAEDVDRRIETTVAMLEGLFHASSPASTQDTTP